uniref:Transmembrane protein 275 n=1 Tax=Fundulus heteroclitus TaxID=8078 RepID=A0A3Q2TVN6_FUNHE
MALAEKRSSAPGRTPDQRSARHQSLPSPALCCACGLCIMLAGINITLVGAFAFGTFSLAANPPIIIGPLLLLLALGFFVACCVASRRPPSHAARKARGGEKWGLMRMGAAAFEMEMSEHTLQDTTAVQLSPTNSPSSSHKSTSNQGDGAGPADTRELQPSEPSDTSAAGDKRSVTSERKQSASTQLLADQNTFSST